MEITPTSPVFPMNPFEPRQEVTTYQVTDDAVKEVTYVYNSDGALESTRVVIVDVEA